MERGFEESSRPSLRVVRVMTGLLLSVYILGTSAAVHNYTTTTT